MIRMKSILPILGLFLFTYQASFSQSYAPLNWYFGNSSNSIRFKKSDNTPVVDPFEKRTPFGTVAAAAVTNPDNGNLIFYTDGQKVYDHTHTVIPSLTATSLSANPNFNQGVVVVPVPGNNDQYFILTNNGTIRYSIF